MTMHHAPNFVRWLTPFAASALFATVSGCATSAGTVSQASTTQKLDRIRHVVVIYAENHSFDNMYGLFPGANGIKNATPEQYTQLDHDGTPLKELVTFGRNGKPMIGSAHAQCALSHRCASCQPTSDHRGAKPDSQLLP